MSEITLGLDAEVFVLDTDKDDIIPVCGLIGGTKRAPKQIQGMPSGFMVQEDNVTLEFNIPPATSLHEWETNINSALLGIGNILETHPKGRLSFVAASHHEFRMQQLSEHPISFIVGCEGDKNAYTGKNNPSPSVYEMAGIRTAGAHIHIGYPKPSYAMNRKLVIALDFLIGKTLKKQYNDSVRERFYGKLGAYRDKPYGVEYRALSSYWLGSSENIASIYMAALNAYKIAKFTPLTSLINISTYEDNYTS